VTGVCSPPPADALPAAGLWSGSLCTGCGGLDLAAAAVLGARLAWCAESDKHAAAVLAARYPGVPNLPPRVHVG
jgi:site-specific DNA-cytosine methylase